MRNEMAHAARINDLAEDLVANVAGLGKDQPNFKQVLNETTKGLRNSSYARTNQFEVRSKLDGLVEKFSIINRDDLSEALQTRLDELPTTSKWLPEFLSLLLLLSDRPAEKTNADDLEAVLISSEEQPLPTWTELLAEEPPDESGLWDDIDRGYHSSGDEATVDDGEDTTSTHATSVEEEDLDALARRDVMQPDDSVLEDIRRTHDRMSGKSSDVAISELKVVRESLSMLHGLPTSVYGIDTSTGEVSPTQRFMLDTATRPVLNDMLASCSNMGSSLNILRRWVRIEQQEHYLQSCQTTIQSLLAQFGSQLAKLERKYASHSVETVVSFIDIWSEVESSGRSFMHLSRLVQKSQRQSSTSSFPLLDLLFKETCAAQLSGDVDLSRTLGCVLIAGLRAYLIPVSKWIRNGSLNNPGQTFFIVEADKNCDRGRIWYDRFAMPRGPSGLLPIPTFLQDFAEQIFALGKSRAFFSALNDSRKENTDEIEHELPDLGPLEHLLDSGSLTQFSQVLDDTLSTLIASIHDDCASLLCKTLIEEHGLLKTFDGLANLFCSKDGTLFQIFADTLFWRIDTGKSWRDRFLLTELAQTTLGSSMGVNPQTISIRLTDEPETHPSNSSIRHLESLELNLDFPWPIRNITRSPSPSSYSHAFTLLLQIYRAKYLLRHHVSALRNLTRTSEKLTQRLSLALRVRQALLAMIDVLHNHITSTVSLLSANLHQNIEAAEDIDTMAIIWTEHEKEMGTSLLLTANLKPLRETVNRLLQLCEEFHDVWRGLMDNVEDGTPPHRALPDVQADLEDSLSFIIPGLRATSRAGGNAALDALADRLQWCSSKRR